MVRFHDTLYVPDLRTNLISVGKITDKGFRVTFDKEKTEGKMSRSPSPKRSERESNPGDLVHSDVCGPMRNTSKGGSRSFVTFIDDHSGWCEVKFIDHKNRVLGEFENYRALVETQERRNRTLMETARCLLIRSGLPPSFWAEAVNTANLIRNRCPTSRLKGRTPYEAWYGKSPNVPQRRGLRLPGSSQDGRTQTTWTRNVPHIDGTSTS
ncbi:retrovirus-related pol polyprotein from transposon tnt 1-94 [Lasius niger]|uniref:Retrovirus-related pol polyprotein from transposon tnt 1-94 n=1 Tax=Lasius niger TaxID=67767 RepID=A0A0J7KXR6_LASNI|nr:retrovirus-related pol polyprotein from transposon tnt 1-94 [Lasius niger]KMQ95347.1 retrovirus-related pol polyprotein from transposon tnt 1-94 [Lasius niger]